MEGEHERGWAALLILEVCAFDVDGVYVGMLGEMT